MALENLENLDLFCWPKNKVVTLCHRIFFCELTWPIKIIFQTFFTRNNNVRLIGHTFSLLHVQQMTLRKCNMRWRKSLWATESGVRRLLLFPSFPHAGILAFDRVQKTLRCPFQKQKSWPKLGYKVQLRRGTLFGNWLQGTLSGFPASTMHAEVSLFYFFPSKLYTGSVGSLGKIHCKKVTWINSRNTIVGDTLPVWKSRNRLEVDWDWVPLTGSFSFVVLVGPRLQFCFRFPIRWWLPFLAFNCYFPEKY